MGGKVIAEKSTSSCCRSRSDKDCFHHLTVALHLLRNQRMSHNTGLPKVKVSDRRITVSGVVKPVEQPEREIRGAVHRRTGWWCKVERLCVTAGLPAPCVDRTPLKTTCILFYLFIFEIIIGL